MFTRRTRNPGGLGSKRIKRTPRLRFARNPTDVYTVIPSRGRRRYYYDGRVPNEKKNRPRKSARTTVLRSSRIVRSRPFHHSATLPLSFSRRFFYVRDRIFSYIDYTVVAVTALCCRPRKVLARAARVRRKRNLNGRRL